MNKRGSSHVAPGFKNVQNKQACMETETIGLPTYWDLGQWHVQIISNSSPVTEMNVKFLHCPLGTPTHDAHTVRLNLFTAEL